jgi:cytochrome P450
MAKPEHFRVDGLDRSQANRRLLGRLSDDKERADLYRWLLEGPGFLKFQSRADARELPTQDPVFHQDVYLLAARELIEQALTDSRSFSNSPYQALGATFMLGLDGADHQMQRKFAEAFLGVGAPQLNALATLAFEAGAVLPLKQPEFDLAEVAEQVALRFAGFLFGFAQIDHAELAAAMRAAYRSLCYQIIGRHFATDLGTVEMAALPVGALVNRVAYLIDLYREPIGRAQVDELKRIDAELDELRRYTTRARTPKDLDPAKPCLQTSGEETRPLKHFEPILRELARGVAAAPPDYTTTDLAVVVVGLIAGTVGNIQASVCIAIDAILRDAARFENARTAAGRSQFGVSGARKDLEAFIWEALRLNPPAAFLARKTIEPVRAGGEKIPKDTVVLLAMGAATRDGSNDPLIFGGPAGGAYVHSCIGEHLAMPVVSCLVREVLLLPGLAVRSDPRTGEPLPLRKLWGFVCEEYPLQFDREELLVQHPLILVMNVKTPVALHAETLKVILKYGAPAIEQKLREASHVHFAWFTFLENDTKLMLSTVYDRGLDAYLAHFARNIGPLFDLIFQHLEDAPAAPVSEFPQEFIDVIWRHNMQPAADYFFSAYPMADVSKITHEFPPEEA